MALWTVLFRHLSLMNAYMQSITIGTRHPGSTEILLRSVRNSSKAGGFSEDFVKIFYNKKAEGWESYDDWDTIDENEHKYLDKYDKEVLDKMRYEYKNRYNDYPTP